MNDTINILLTVALAAYVSSAPAQAPGPTFPTKPVRIVVAFPPGGGTDIPRRGRAVRHTSLVSF